MPVDTTLAETTLLLPSAFPPGCEEYALGALTFAFQVDAVKGAFGAASTTFKPPAGMGALALLSGDCQQASKMLLEGYAAAGLGLVPEDASQKGLSSRASSKSRSQVLEGAGSLLPLQSEWLFYGVSLHLLCFSRCSSQHSPAARHGSSTEGRLCHFHLLGSSYGFAVGGAGLGMVPGILFDLMIASLVRSCVR